MYDIIKISESFKDLSDCKIYNNLSNLRNILGKNLLIYYFP